MFKLNYDTGLSFPQDPGTPDFRFNQAWSNSPTWMTIDDFDGDSKSTAGILQSLGTPYHITLTKVGTPTTFKVLKVTGVTDYTGYTYLTISQVATSGSAANTDEFTITFSKDGVEGSQGAQGDQGAQGAPGTNGSNGATGAQGAAGSLSLTGTTANGMITYDGSGSSATVESTVTYSGGALSVNADLVANDIKVKTLKTGTPSAGVFYPGSRTADSWTSSFQVNKGFIYRLTSGGGNTTWTAAQADSEANGSGMLVVATSAGNSQEMLIEGVIRSVTTLSSGSAGDIVYLSDSTAGAFTLTAPSGANKIVRIVGYLVNPSNSLVFFKPSTDWVELSS